MTEKEAFKVGFISRCVEGGFSSPAQIAAQADIAMEKAAILDSLIGTGSRIAGGALDVGGKLLSSAAGWGIPALALAPPALGGLAGYTLANATDIDDTDVAELKQQELVDEYRRQTEKILRDRRRQAQTQTSASGRRRL